MLGFTEKAVDVFSNYVRAERSSSPPCLGVRRKNAARCWARGPRGCKFPPSLARSLIQCRVSVERAVITVDRRGSDRAIGSAGLMIRPRTRGRLWFQSWRCKRTEIGARKREIRDQGVWRVARRYFRRDQRSECSL
jgi:hypothetical protein